MGKQIISIGFDIPGHSDLFNGYRSEQSLLDADIVIFEPTIYGYHTDDSYQGKTCYSADASFRLTEDTMHWRTELSTALENGKTVFVFFAKFKEFFVHTGGKQYSGTGRNTRITNIVTNGNNYEFFPVKLPKIIAKSGCEMRFLGSSIFATFWSEFRKYLRYESYFDEKMQIPLFLTKTGEKAIGALFKIGKGNLVLLPPLRYPEDIFTSTDKEGKEEWNAKGVQFGDRLIQVLVDIDKALREAVETTPPPEWVGMENYILPEVDKIKEIISKLSKKIDELTSQKNTYLKSLTDEERLWDLLYEKGKPLENAIILGLQILGYAAEHYDDGFLELDQIIISPEKDRFIGEAEGKDNSQVNIDKFRQLENNIQEDLQRDEVKEPAIGILFGNAFRLTEPDQRKEYFTTKCVKNAGRLNVIMMRTPDLFRVAQYVKTTKDKEFAKKCREAIMQGRGKTVVFPDVPNS